MKHEEKAPGIARKDTDKSLREEREKTDDELAARRVSIEEDSDAVVDRARDKADQVLQAARTQEDKSAEGKAAPAAAQVSRERGKEDKLLKQERAVADEQLEKERVERNVALKELLRLERESTDQHLLVERARSDEAVFSRDDFMGMVSHDLRAMLGGIALNASMIVKASGTAESDRANLRRAEGIQRFTAKMNRLIGDLVDVASLEAGKLHISAQLGNPSSLIQESLDAFLPTASAKELTLEAEVEAGSYSAHFDPERILQVLANLLSNAIKFTPKGGRVGLKLDSIEGQIRFAVSDTGPGIERSKQETVFKRFWQAEPAEARGMGLGLYISQSIVNAHGGRIWVESKPPEGSVFYFTLPAA